MGQVLPSIVNLLSSVSHAFILRGVPCITLPLRSLTTSNLLSMDLSLIGQCYTATHVHTYYAYTLERM